MEASLSLKPCPFSSLISTKPSPFEEQNFNRRQKANSRLVKTNVKTSQIHHTWQQQLFEKKKTAKNANRQIFTDPRSFFTHNTTFSIKVDWQSLWKSLWRTCNGEAENF